MTKKNIDKMRKKFKRDFKNGESEMQKEFQQLSAIYLKEVNKDNDKYCQICGDHDDLKQIIEPDNRYLCTFCIAGQKNLYNVEFKFKDEQDKKSDENKIVYNDELLSLLTETLMSDYRDKYICEMIEKKKNL